MTAFSEVDLPPAARPSRGRSCSTPAKTLAKDKPDWLSGHGELPAYPGALVTKAFDYHAVVELQDGTPTPDPGEVVAVALNHACAVVNLADRWAVDLRARS